MDRYRKFTWHVGQMKILGIFQILLGSACVLMSIPFLVVFYKRRWDYYNWNYVIQTLTYVSPGIWSGFFSLLAGILGVMVSKKSSVCYVVVQIIASFLSFFASAAMLGIEVSQTIIASSFNCLNNPLGNICDDNNNSNWYLDSLVPATFAFMYFLTMSLVAFTAVIVATFQSGYGCYVASGGESDTNIHPVAADNQTQSTRTAPQPAFLEPGTFASPQHSVPMQLYQLQPIGISQQAQSAFGTNVASLHSDQTTYQNPGFVHRESTMPLIQAAHPTINPSGTLKREITLPPIQTTSNAPSNDGHVKREVTLPPIQPQHTPSNILPPIQAAHSSHNPPTGLLNQEMTLSPDPETSDLTNNPLDPLRLDAKLPPIVQQQEKSSSNLEPESHGTDSPISELLRQISDEHMESQEFFAGIESPDSKPEEISDTQDKSEQLQSNEHEEQDLEEVHDGFSAKDDTGVQDDNRSTHYNGEEEQNLAESRADSPVLEETIPADETRSESDEDEKRRTEEAAEAERKQEEEKLKRLAEAAAKRREKEERKRARREARRAEKQAKAMEEKERLRFILEDAIDGDDQSSLESAINEYKSAKSKHRTSDDMLAKAERLFQMLQIREALKDASARRKIDDLEETLQKVRNMDFNESEDELALEFAQANELLERLKRIERLRSEVMELQQTTIAEIRSYQNPMPAVHQVMTATYLLLGTPAKQTRKWSNIQSLMGKTGREGLKRRISNCNISDISPSDALKARSIMGDADLEVIRDVSAGAATFYVWVESMIEEVLNEK